MAAWHLAVTYASICLAITQRAPILPHMKDAAGNVLAEFTVRVNKTCWEVHHGEKFRGPMQPFGRLCFYLDKDHPLEPTTKPGIFIGWRLERGLRYRGVLNILDYGNARKGIFAIRSIQRCPVAEVYFPPELEYPFKNARELALKDCSDELKLADTPIPFEIGEAGSPSARPLPPVRAPPIGPRFKITLQRMLDHEPTPDCPACDSANVVGVHTPACRARFRKILEDQGVIARSVTPAEASEVARAEEEAAAEIVPDMADMFTSPEDAEAATLAMLGEVDRGDGPSSPVPGRSVAAPETDRLFMAATPKKKKEQESK